MLFQNLILICSLFASAVGMNLSSGVIEPPDFSLDSGSYYVETCENYSDGLVISFEERMDEATIYYCIGSGEYVEYTEPFLLYESTQIKAYAETKSGKSKVIKENYKLRTEVVPSVASGIYNEKLWLQLTHKDCECVNLGETKIYYTLDGSSPFKEGILYDMTKGITIDNTCTLTLMIVPSNNNVITYKRINYVISPSDISDKYEEKYYYNTLSEKEQSIYRRLFYAAERGENALLSDMNLTLNEAWTAVEAFFYENPQFLIDYYIIRVPYKYVTEVLLIKDEDYLDKKDELNNYACNILKEVKGDNLKQILQIHDKLVSFVDYNLKANDKFNAAGAIVNKKAVCQGYAMAFTYLCQLLGIECVTVKGTTEFGDHAWNMVKVNDRWYNVDVCWDDTDLYDYDYFCVTDDKISHTHKLEMSVAHP